MGFRFLPYEYVITISNIGIEYIMAGGNVMLTPF